MSYRDRLIHFGYLSFQIFGFLLCVEQFSVYIKGGASSIVIIIEEIPLVFENVFRLL